MFGIDYPLIYSSPDSEPVTKTDDTPGRLSYLDE